MGQSAAGPLTEHMGGVLSSIPLCSRAKELQDVPELDLRPEEKPESPVTVTQPQPVSQTCIDNENHREKSVEPVHNTVKFEIDEPPPLESDIEEPSDEKEEGFEDVDVELTTEEEIPADNGDGEAVTETEDEAYRKTPPDLDTTAAITNILSEIVGDSDSRAVVGR